MHSYLNGEENIYKKFSKLFKKINVQFETEFYSASLVIRPNFRHLGNTAARFNKSATC